MRVAQENFVSVDIEDECDQISSPFATDPLSGTTTDRPTLYRLNSIVFAEPAYGQNSENLILDELPSSPYNYDIEQPTQRTKKSKDAKDSEESSITEKLNDANIERNMAKSQNQKSGKGDVKQFECGMCDATFSQRYLLKRHAHVHGGATQTCPTCHKKLSVRTQIAREATLCNLCSQCPQRRLAVHMRSHSPARRFECAHCGRGFTRRAGLALHARFLHPTADSLACALCGERFARRAQLERHEATLHAPARRLTCERCGRMCSTLAALAAHAAKTHRGQKDTVKPKPVDPTIGPPDDNSC